MHYNAVVARLLASLPLMCTFPAQAGSPPINVGGVLQARVVSIGRDKTYRNLTVTMTLENKGNNIIYLLLIPPVGYRSPRAVDNTGVDFRYVSGSGMAVCQDSVTSRCIGVPDVVPNITPPLQAWTELDPGDGPVTLTFDLTATTQESHGPMGLFASILAYRLVTDPRRDGDLSDKEKRQQIHTRLMIFR
jgi:hypothetical protein